MVLLSDLGSLGSLGGLRVGLSQGQVVELSRNANTLHVAGKTCGVAGGAACIGSDNKGSCALLALAGLCAEVDIGENHLSAGAKLNPEGCGTDR